MLGDGEGDGLLAGRWAAGAAWLALPVPVIHLAAGGAIWAAHRAIHACAAGRAQLAFALLPHVDLQQHAAGGVGLPAGPAAAWQLGCTEVPLPSTPWCWYAGKAADRTATAFRNPRPAAPSAVAQPIRPAQAPGPRPQAPGPRPQAPGPSWPWRTAALTLVQPLLLLGLPAPAALAAGQALPVPVADVGAGRLARAAHG
jgi:hypothetical protein